MKLNPTNNFDRGMWLAILVLLPFAIKEIFFPPPRVNVWRVQSVLAGRIVSEFYVTNRLPIEIGVTWTTNVTGDGIVITGNIYTNNLQ